MQNKYEYQYQAADAAGISSKTAHKYLKSGKLHSQCRVEHTSGQPPKINTKQIKKFKQRIRQGVTEQDNVCSLRGKDLQQVLQKEFNK